MKKAYFYVIAAAVLWGTMGLFVRNMTGMGITQAQIVLLRVLVSSVTLLPVLLIKDKKLLKVLLYTSPAFVMLLSAVLFKERLTASRLEALALVFAGCVYGDRRDWKPAVATLVGMIVFREVFGWYNLVGIVLLFLGILVLSRAKGRETGGAPAAAAGKE